MHILLYVDEYDVRRIKLLEKYLFDKDYVHLKLDTFVLYLINTRQRSEVHLSCQDNYLIDSEAPLKIELSPDTVCAITLSHIGQLHSGEGYETFLQRFYFNEKEYPVGNDLQLHLREYWQKIHEAPHIAVARVGSEPIKRLLLRAKESHDIFREIEAKIKDA